MESLRQFLEDVGASRRAAKTNSVQRAINTVISAAVWAVSSKASPIAAALGVDRQASGFTKRDKYRKKLLGVDESEPSSDDETAMIATTTTTPTVCAERVSSGGRGER